MLTMDFMSGGKVDDKQYMDQHGISTYEVRALVCNSVCLVHSSLRVMYQGIQLCMLESV